MTMSKIVLVSTVLLAMTDGCRSVTTPTQKRIVGLQITPETMSVKVGLTTAFSAVATHTDGARQTVTGAWTSDPSTIASVDPTGHVTALTPGTSILRVTFENNVASRSLTVVPDVEATWVGSFEVTSCTRLSGNGTDYCRSQRGQVFPMQLILKHAGADDISGTLTLDDDIGHPVESGAINGSVDINGNLLIDGTLKSLTDDPTRQTRLRDWNSTLSGDNGMKGQFTRDRVFANLFGPQTSIEGCAIRNLQR